MSSSGANYRWMIDLTQYSAWVHDLETFEGHKQFIMSKYSESKIVPGEKRHVRQLIEKLSQSGCYCRPVADRSDQVIEVLEDLEVCCQILSQDHLDNPIAALDMTRNTLPDEVQYALLPDCLVLAVHNVGSSRNTKVYLLLLSAPGETVCVDPKGKLGQTADYTTELCITFSRTERTETKFSEIRITLRSYWACLLPDISEIHRAWLAQQIDYVYRLMYLYYSQCSSVTWAEVFGRYTVPTRYPHLRYFSGKHELIKNQIMTIVLGWRDYSGELLYLLTQEGRVTEQLKALVPGVLVQLCYGDVWSGKVTTDGWSPSADFSYLKPVIRKWAVHESNFYCTGTQILGTSLHLAVLSSVAPKWVTAIIGEDPHTLILLYCGAKPVSMHTGMSIKEIVAWIKARKETLRLLSHYAETNGVRDDLMTYFDTMQVWHTVWNKIVDKQYQTTINEAGKRTLNWLIQEGLA